LDIAAKRMTGRAFPIALPVMLVFKIEVAVVGGGDSALKKAFS
jgi:hypothetical protein